MNDLLPQFAYKLIEDLELQETKNYIGEFQWYGFRFSEWAEKVDKYGIYYRDLKFNWTASVTFRKLAEERHPALYRSNDRIEKSLPSLLWLIWDYSHYFKSVSGRMLTAELLNDPILLELKLQTR